MKIGVDLDDTLTKTMAEIVDFHNDKYGTNLSVEKLKDGATWKTWGGTHEDDVKKIHNFHLSSYGQDIPSITEAKDILERLKKENNDLYIITARSDYIKKDTEEWVEKNFPNIFSKIYFTNQFLNNETSTTKRKICDELGIDIFIEDNISYALDCAKPGRKIFLLDYPWNQTDSLPEDVTRVKSWQEIGEKLFK